MNNLLSLFFLMLSFGAYSANMKNYNQNIGDKNSSFQNVHETLEMLEQESPNFTEIRNATKIIGYQRETKELFTSCIKKNIENYLKSKKQFFLQFGDIKKDEPARKYLEKNINKLTVRAIEIDYMDLYQQAIYYIELLFSPKTKLRENIENIIMHYVYLLVKDHEMEDDAIADIVAKILKKLSGEQGSIYIDVAEKIKKEYGHFIKKEQDQIGNCNSYGEDISLSPKRYTVKINSIEEKLERLELFLKEQKNSDGLITKSAPNIAINNSNNKPEIFSSECVSIEEYRKLETRIFKLIQENETLKRIVLEFKSKSVRKAKPRRKLKKSNSEKLQSKNSSRAENK